MLPDNRVSSRHGTPCPLLASVRGRSRQTVFASLAVGGSFLNEVAFRLDEGNCKVLTLVRMDSFVCNAF